MRVVPPPEDQAAAREVDLLVVEVQLAAVLVAHQKVLQEAHPEVHREEKVAKYYEETYNQLAKASKVRQAMVIPATLTIATLNSCSSDSRKPTLHSKTD